jgi:thiol-disulfide isomerase/thioredoxin
MRFPALLLALSLAALPAPAGPSGAAKGGPAPAFSLQGLKAGSSDAKGPVTLAGLEGKVVLLDFWAAWCAPCKRTLPELARLGGKHPGLEVLAVSLDEDRSKAEAFLARLGKASAGLTALHDAGREVAGRYGLEGMPAAVLIDRKGILRSRFDGYTERDLGKMEAEIQRLLQEKP